MPNEPVPARCIDLVKTYRTPTGAVHALRGVTLEFEAGALTAVVGPSGSGKSSLLRVLTGIDRATSGDVWVGPKNVARASARGLRRLRRDTVGYVFQRPSDNFLPNLTIAEHLRLAAGSNGTADLEILDRLGIGHRAEHLPDELSGGEQQRAAFAQAVVAGSAVVVADEPTAELDSESSKLVMDGVRTLVNSGVTFVVATHDGAVRRLADEVVELDHGRLKGAHRTPTDGRHVSGGRIGRLPVDASDAAVSVHDLTKVFHHHGGDVVHALESVTFDARPGELVGLVGRSGSGKTTLLNVIAGWERPTSGEVRWRDGVDAAEPPWSAVAVVPQKLGLMEELTVEENVAYPARLAGRSEERSDHIEELIGQIGIFDLRSRYPREASVGEQQRTAIARALAVPTSVLLADEPTAHQDAVSAERVFAALRRAADAGTAVAVATHNREVIKYLDRVMTMKDGRLEENPRT
ncbi:MAG TPA: ATP-binding cassette domain-containing protein [Actinomycetota bacterium]|nr:ATP-binding cassette domain-containing protein [Actinomycetota bacterium]